MLHILVGKPGTGKGTQAHMLSGRLGYKHISMGDLLRTAAKGDKELAAALAAGELAPEGVCHHILKQALRDICFDNTPMILDGFPRSVRQAEQLNPNLIGSVIHLKHGDDEALMERLRGRNRSDDKDDTIVRRLQVYREETRPLLEYYERLAQTIDGRRGYLLPHAVNANRSAEDVYLDIAKIIKDNNC